MASRVQTGVEEVEEGEDDAAGDGRVRASHVPHELLPWRTVVVGLRSGEEDAAGGRRGDTHFDG